MVFAQRYYGSFHVAESFLRLRFRLKEELLGVGLRQPMLAKYGLLVRGWLLCWNFRYEISSERGETSVDNGAGLSRGKQREAL
jgi:hypothetical protein